MSKEFNTYDYIIVGAGAAGSVLAARLAENPYVSILLLERGHDNSLSSHQISTYNKELISIPANSVELVKRYHSLEKTTAEKRSLGPPSQCKLEASPSLSDYVTTFQNDSRYYAYPRGHGAGGSTNHHSMVDGRGSPLIYDRIAKAVKDDIWAYKNILKYYKKMENYTVPHANPHIHGKDGWLQIRRAGHPRQDLLGVIADTIVSEFDVPLRSDPADPEQVSGVHFAEEQVGLDGQRSYAYRDLLEPMMKKQSNIKVKFNCLVKKVITEKFHKHHKKIRAIGVAVYEKPYLFEVDISGNQIKSMGNQCYAVLPDRELPTPTHYYARKEVILCAGALATPQILMLSGIGPQSHLKKHNIEVVADLQGVGQNLMDHIECNIIYELDPNKILWEWQATYMKRQTDYKRLANPHIQRQIEKFANIASLANNNIGLAWDWNANLSRKNLDDPDMHVLVINGFNFDFNYEFDKFPKGDRLHVKEHAKDGYLPDSKNPSNRQGVPHLKKTVIESQTDPTNPRVFLTFLNECMRIKATGQITLKDKDARSQPVINLGLWSDDLAVKKIAQMIFNIRRLMKNCNLLQYAKNPTSFEFLPGPQFDTIEKLTQYVKDWQSYGHHLSGTARMGHSDDDGAVLDSRLRVKGVHGLRVVDASVYPEPHLHAYNPSRGVYMMAEVAADFIKKEYSWSFH